MHVVHKGYVVRLPHFVLLCAFPCVVWPSQGL